MSYKFKTIVGKALKETLLLTTIAIFLFVANDCFAKNAQQTLNVGVLSHFPPQYALSPQSEPIGLAIDLIEAVVKESQYDLKYTVYDSWETIQAALIDKEIDLIPNMGIAEFRKQWADFTFPLETFPVSLFVRNGSAQITTLTELENQRVGVVKLNVGEKIISQHPEVVPVFFENVNDALLALLSGNINGLIFPQPILNQLTRQARVSEKIKTVGAPLLEVKRGIAVAKGNKSLVDSLNANINRLITSPEYQEIYTKWYGSKPGYWTLKRAVTTFVFISFLGFAAMFLWRHQSVLLFNRKLKSTVTKLQDTEKSLLDLNLNLEERVLERTQELKLMHDDLTKAHSDLKSSQGQLLHQEKMASIGQLAAGVAHEINNPIGFIKSNLNTLKKYSSRFQELCNWQATIMKSPELTPAIADEFKQIHKKLKIDFMLEDLVDLVDESLEGTQRVSTIVQNLKTFSRADADEIQEVDLNDCIEGSLNIIWNELKYKVTVEKNYEDLPLVSCHSQQLSQVFMNLLLNASQAIEKQGVIKIHTWADSDYVNVCISDDGCGIPDENLNRIFEPFYTTKEVGKGTGLGLSIVYDVIKGHVGEIVVSSELDKGTAFTLMLPFSMKQKRPLLNVPS